MTHPLLTRPALTLYSLAAFIAIPYLVPAKVPHVARLRLLQPREEAAPAPPVNVPVPEVGEAAIGATDDQAGTPAEPTVAGGKQGLPFAKPLAPIDPKPLLDGPPPRSIEDASTTALDAFYASLDRVERKEDGAIARITYYGDSVIASDWITATLRRKLQARFGDAGHGFILIADAWAGYHHDNIARFASKGWKVSRVVGPYAPDGLYGLGGVSFIADGPGMFATVGTATSGDFGRAVSRFVVTYAEQPNGGKLSLKLDDGEARIVATAAEATVVKTIEIDAPDGAHKLEIRSNGGGPVRVFHVVLERSGPGVVVDAVGIIGCRLRFLDKIDDAHWKDELQRRDPALIAFTYGANESGDAFAYPMDKYEETARAVLKQAKEALPRASCLLVGPMDAADKKGDSFVSRPVIPAINEIQRKLAKELGCGFFDTWSAMGGYGSMGVWIQRGLGGADLVHPTSVGAEVIGGWVHKALMEGYAGWKARAR